jgi:hypothetical protein
VIKIARLIFRFSELFALITLFVGFASAQTTFERTFAKPPADVQRAVDDLREAARGRLPTLEGFVETPDQPLEQYQRGYYECTFQVSPASSGGSKVQATAKITAWFTDPTPARSGYRVLVSNGHVENDLLDQIQEALGPGAVAPAGKAPPAQANAPSGGLRPQLQTDSSGLSSGESSSLKGTSRHSMPPRQPAESVAPPTPAAAAGESVESMKLRRANDEKLAQELSAQIRTLEEALHNQVRPTDLAVVKKSATPIQTKPSENSQTLLTADAEDEFQIIETDGSWVHVQISGASRGWIRRSQVDLPADYGKPAPKIGTAPTGTSVFSVSKQETKAFGGNWEPLKGRTVKIFWVEPASATENTTPRQKLDFAKALFLKSYAEASSTTPPVEGIVIVFDSADGGQIAATLSSLKQMAAGDLSEDAFWKQCSLDPPESFRDSTAP